MEPLGALYDEMHKKYEGISILIHYFSKKFIFIKIYQNHQEQYFHNSDLPKDAKAFEVDKILNLNTEQLQTETTGEKIIQEIQEWLLTQASSPEAAVLPDDRAQCLLVRVQTLLFLSIHL